MSYQNSYKQLGNMNTSAFGASGGCAAGGCGIGAPRLASAPAFQIVPVYGGMGYNTLQHGMGQQGSPYFTVQGAYQGNQYSGACSGSGDCIAGCYGVKPCNSNSYGSVSSESVGLAFY